MGEVTGLLYYLRTQPILFIVIVIAVTMIILGIKLFPSWLKYKREVLVQNDDCSKCARACNFDLRLDAIDTALVQLVDCVDRLALNVYLIIINDRRASVYDRLRSGYEYFMRGGNHGTERYFVKEVVCASQESLKEWTAVVLNNKSDNAPSSPRQIATFDRIDALIADHIDNCKCD